MIFETYKPTGILKSSVESYLVVKTEKAISRTKIPETSPVLSFRSTGHHRFQAGDTIRNLPLLAITGVRNSVKQIFLSENTETILVKFKPCKSFLFFKEPLHNFSNTSVSLYDFLPRQAVSDVEYKLKENCSMVEKIGCIENFLLLLFRCDCPDHSIHAAVQKIVQSNGILKIKDLATYLNMSIDAFEKQFRKITGTSPKHFSSIVRLTNLIKNTNRNHSLSKIAYEYGYYDQSHFIKDFKLFTGKTPLDYFKSEPV